MKEKQSRDSWFVGTLGLILLLVCAVLSIYFQAWVIGAFLCFMFLLCFGSRTWSRAVLRRVDISVKAIQESCHAGELLRLKMQVRNRSFLPLVWLDVILPMGRKPLVRSEGQEECEWFFLKGETEVQTGVRNRFVWLLWQQEITWEETLRTICRGSVEITGAALQAGDGFGLSARESWKPFPTPLRLLVYPRIVPIAVQSFLKINQEAVAQSRGQTEDITILKSSRPYQPGDSIKRINWRLLAGSQKMEVNVYETVMPGCAAFLLDLASFRYEAEQEDSSGGSWKEKRLKEPELEAMISLIASCMRAVDEHGILTALVLPAYGDREAVFCMPGGDESIWNRSMEALAMIDYKKEDVRFPYEEFWQAGHKLGNIYLCCESEENSTLGELAHHLGRSRVKYLTLKRGVTETGEFDCIYGEEIALERLFSEGKAGDAA